MKVFVIHISFLFLSSYGVMLINQFGMYSGTAHLMLQLQFPVVFTQRFVFLWLIKHHLRNTLVQLFKDISMDN